MENAVISSNLNNIRELQLESIGRRLQEIESTFSKVCSPSLVELPKDQAVNNVIYAIFNDSSIAIVYDLEGKMKTIYVSIVDSSDIAHIKKVVNKSGDYPAGHALQRKLYVVQDYLPGSLLDLSRAEIFGACTDDQYNNSQKTKYI